MNEILTDAEYIKELEGMLRVMATFYQSCKETYFDKHFKTCSRANPDRRELTMVEHSEWQRFPLIQGTKLQHIVLTIAKSEKDNPEKIDAMIARFEQ